MLIQMLVLIWVHNFRYADRVFIGNEVLVEGDDQLIPTKVLNISSIDYARWLKFILDPVFLKIFLILIESMNARVIYEEPLQ